jgi:hypothetical protein
MQIRLSDKVREYLKSIPDRDIDLNQLRIDLNISKGSPAWEGLRKLMFQLIEEKIVRPSGRKDGTYHVIKPAHPVALFSVSRERSLPFELHFPIDADRFMPLEFAEDIIIREGDIVTIGGVSNFGKTAMALNFCAQNVDINPVLMGNEYTTIDGEPDSRLLNRLEKLDWVKWVNDDGSDKVTLLPVWGDYAQHVIKDRLNIIDWINLNGNQLYDISQIMQQIKFVQGKGVSILVLQKGENSNAPRGGQFAKDFTQCELLIDKFTESESLLTIGKVKESTYPIMGKTYAYSIAQGIKIINFREVVSCPDCRGSKYVKNEKCTRCQGKGKVDK